MLLFRRLSLVCAASAAALSLTAQTSVIPLPAGTSIPVHLTEPLSIANASAGQTFALSAGPLLMQGLVVMYEGANGQGHVVSVKPAKGNTKASMVVQFDWVQSVDGRHLFIQATKKNSDGLVVPSDHIGTDTSLSAFVSTDTVVSVSAGGS